MGFGGGPAFGLDVGNLPTPDDLLQRAPARLGVGAENHPIAMDWMGRGDDPFDDPFAGADELFDDWIKFDFLDHWIVPTLRWGSRDYLCDASAVTHIRLSMPFLIGEASMDPT